MALDKMFSDYLYEKEGKSTVFVEEGFIVYKLLPQSNEFWICFIYIKPEHRCGGTFKFMMDLILDMAQAAKSRQIIADIDYRNSGSEQSLQIFLKRGLKIGEIRDNHTIWLYYPLINKSNEQKEKELLNG